MMPFTKTKADSRSPNLKSVMCRCGSLRSGVSMPRTMFWSTWVAVVVALLRRRRRPEPPTQARWEVPTQLDRADFPRPDSEWLVVVFTSATCDSCARATAKAEVLESEQVAYAEVPYQTGKD